MKKCVLYIDEQSVQAFIVFQLYKVKVEMDNHVKEISSKRSIKDKFDSCHLHWRQTHKFIVEQLRECCGLNNV